MKVRRPRDRRVAEWTVRELLKWTLIEKDIKAVGWMKKTQELTSFCVDNHDESIGFTKARILSFLPLKAGKSIHQMYHPP